MVAKRQQTARPGFRHGVTGWLGRFVPDAVARLGIIPGPYQETTTPSSANAQEAEEERFRRVALSYAIIAIAAKLSNADGLTTSTEFYTFRDLFPMSGEWDSKCARIFANAIDEPTGVAYYAQQIYALYPSNDTLRGEVFDRLFQLAICDGALSEEEQQILLEIAGALSIPEKTVLKLVKRHTTKSNDPYQILGVGRHAKEQDVKQAHRRLIREYHPDGLKAYGYSDAQAARASAKLAEINAAYDAVRKAKGWK